MSSTLFYLSWFHFYLRLKKLDLQCVCLSAVNDWFAAEALMFVHASSVVQQSSCHVCYVRVSLAVVYACICSYKEESDDATDSEDLIEIEMTEADHERQAAETVEKVLRHRVGRKGGTCCCVSLTWFDTVVSTNCSSAIDICCVSVLLSLWCSAGISSFLINVCIMCYEKQYANFLYLMLNIFQIT